ncbi:MAG: membrane protein insertion efficiency factor YidD [Proteobacteria bacterium]|nr:membrane protein insertion efficiency factor YidD [Pseudomonadota bacterium]MDA0976694.1 membrane protein insertion efficiency factor YidD [Pseudomonadota bacterium]MDA1037176.1 membrane protein insertion efficiency factor YidD [Pseudomonadota bacterium]
MFVILKKLFILPIIFYRYFISPMFPPSCRFTPTCSQYAIESIEAYGVVKGSILAIKRLSKCHPWYKEQ